MIPDAEQCGNHDCGPIAIVGIGCRFPGSADGPAAFWRLLCEGADAVTEIPPDRWSVRAFYDPEPGTPGKTYTRWGGFLKRIDQFDANFFGIAPREARLMDPQQRLLLEVVYEALEDGGQTLDRLSGSNVGVFVGISTNDYARVQYSIEDRTAIDTYTSTGGVMSLAANRISYCFDFHGPSCIVDTACSSSLVAVHLACRSLRTGECPMAIAGGVNVIICPEEYIGFSKMALLSPDGRCKAFDASGNGFVRSEGAGVVVLKPLAAALADGDEIYAVIRATATNQDGRTHGITVPSQAAQEALLREACAQAGVTPDEIAYFEAHGTGTSVGDPIETNALGAVLGAGRAADDPCIIGSVKTNIGHLEAGAGIAGLIKTALSLKHGLIPPSLHLKTPNPLIPFDELRLRVQQRLGPWPDRKRPRLAGVNSFGFGGTNAHALLAEAPMQTRATSAEYDVETGPAAPVLLALSARSTDALDASARAMAEFVSAGPADGGPALRDIGRTLARRRTHHDYRLAGVARTKREFVDLLESYARGESRPGLRTGRVAREAPRIAFVFSGQGPQWWAMGRQLLAEEPLVRRTIEECDARLPRSARWSLLEVLSAPEAESRLHETSIAQPALFALQVALTKLWQSWGIEPHAVVGHSVGEIAAAHVAGALDLATAMKVIFYRGRCMDRASSKGRMLGVELTAGQALDLIHGYEERVSVAAINSPVGVTLSGDPDALAQLAQELERRNTYFKPLPVEYAFHSPQMDPVRRSLERVLRTVQSTTPTRTMYSTVTGGRVEGMALDADYWWRNVRHPVRFADAIGGLIDEGCNTFVEIGPHPVLSHYVTACLEAKNGSGVALASLRRHEDERFQMLDSLAALYVNGCPVDWTRQYGERASPVRLPGYPWQHESYWHECRSSRDSRLAAGAHPLLGQKRKAADPSWTVQLSRGLLPYLQDHQVQGHVVFPATGYLEMALAGAREVFGRGPWILENVDFHKAFFVPDASEAPALQIVLYTADSSFAIYSATNQTEDRWTLHATGTVRIDRDRPQEDRATLQPLTERCTATLPAEGCYRRFREAGLGFGPSFQGLQELRCGEAAAVGRIAAPPQILADLDEYLIHPAVLDACFHVLSAAVPDDAQRRAPGVFLPVHIDRLVFLNSPGASAWSYAELAVHGATRLSGDITVLKEDGTACVRIAGLTCQLVNTAGDTSDDPAEQWIYETRWDCRPRAGAVTRHRHVDYLPAPADIRVQIESDVRAISDRLGWKTVHGEIRGDLAELCSAYIVRALRELGWEPAESERVTLDGLADRLGVVANRRSVLGRLLDILAMDRRLARDAGGWTVRRIDPPCDIDARWQQILGRFPAFYAELLLTASCGSQLPYVLQGRVNPLHLIFPGDSSIAEHLYQDAPSFKFYNQLIARVVALAAERLPDGRTLRVLEIGGGTAGTTSYAAAMLPPDRSEYVFTDVSSVFLDSAEQKFRSKPFFKYQSLDIERDPVEQGFDAHAFDIVIASDVLHATADLRASLANVRTLLSEGGLLVVLEAENATRWVDLVFGLTDGWWRFTDRDLRPEYPLLPRDAWLRLLAEAGFSHPMAFSEIESADDAGQAVFVARSPAPDATFVADDIRQQPPVATGASAALKRWLLFEDRRGVAARVARRLEQQGGTVISVAAGTTYRRTGDRSFDVRPDRPDDFPQLLIDLEVGPDSTIDAVVHCWSLDARPADASTLASLDDATALGCYSVTHFIQAWAALGRGDAPALALVTGGIHPVGGRDAIAVEQSPLLGLGRVIINEHQEFRCRLIDLSRDPSSLEIQDLVEELIDGDDDNEIALRAGVRFVPRLVHRPSGLSPQPERALTAAPSREYRVDMRAPGVLDNLVVREDAARRPGCGEIAIRVAAAGLNFRDVMKALGIYPDDAADGLLFGDECAGTVTAIGEGVDAFAPGDEVIAIGAGSLASSLVTRAEFAFARPADVSVEEAVTIPIAFLTALYALRHVGRLQPGERVLIHAATGGVGLAALHIARHIGAEVFATAGTEEKRTFLRLLGVRHVMDSRTLAFADQIHKLTDGAGVDVVLNSLAGEAISKGLECLAHGGRFLEIGKRDIYLNSKLGLRCFKKNVSFSAIDLSKVMAERPQQIKQLLGEITTLFAGRARPLPHRSVPIGNVAHAFRHMAKAKHIGKIVLSMRNEDVEVVPPDAPTVAFSRDTTFLITGGFGGFGLALAEWLVDHGATHLVLTSRRGAASADAERALASLEAKGARVLAVRADVTNPNDVARVLDSARRTMPPLRGVVHAAMVLDDGVLLQLDRQRFRKVMDPKVLGAWNLHRLTLDDPLDFFVMFSSATSTCGNPGQGNYAAANAFLDALAHYRRRLHRPALTVNWGNLTDVGHVARHQELDQYLHSIGIGGFSSRQALDALGRLLVAGATHVALLNIDWRLWTKYALVTASPKFSLLTSARPLADDANGGRLRDAVLAAPPEERDNLIQVRLRDEVGRVLGIGGSKLDINQPLNELGVDSLMTVELKNRISKELGVSVPTADLMRGPSIVSLTRLLLAHIMEDVACSAPEPAIQPVHVDQAQRARELLQQVDRMSEHDIDVLLAQFDQEAKVENLINGRE
jgi:acyl transferase domain-containing protein/NADP-dependent 3-hydroxy acid dehydrogenase YdfG/acyl carrier protein